MRRKILSLGLTLGLALGTFGLGVVAAQWMTSKSATETLTVGGVTLNLTSVNGTLNADGSITCPSVAVTSPSGYDPDGCVVTINSTSAAINVTMSSSIAGGNEFGMTIGGSTHPLTVAPITVATFTTAPQTLTAQAVWGVNAGGSPVDSSYFGDVILVTLAITAASA